MDIKSLTISQRLRLFLDEINLGQQEFANAIGVSKQVVSNAVNGRTKFPKSDFLIQVIRAYPQLNIYWLLLGEGEMLSDKPNINFQEELEELKKENSKLKDKIIELLDK